MFGAPATRGGSGKWTSAPLKFAPALNATFPGLEGNLGRCTLPRTPPLAGLRWPPLAFAGLRWPSLAFAGLRWPSLGLIGPR